MIAKTPAILFAVNKFYSEKKDKDYKTLGLVIDGRAKNHFLSDENAESILMTPAVQDFLREKQPVNVMVTFEVYVTEKGWGGRIADIQ